MESTKQLFEQLADPWVKITSIGEIKMYLRNHLDTFRNCPVIGVTSSKDSMYVNIVNGERVEKVFFGYIPDVALNIQNGFYEK